MTKQRHKPKVSVVMSICNEPLPWLRLAVESIQNQTYKNLEIIIVCDNPAFEEGIAYIRQAAEADSRICLLINDTNLGPTKSFNRAIAAAKGEYIARMDADDIAVAERFQKQVDFLDSHPEVSVCATDVHIIDIDGNIVRKNKYRKKLRQELNIIINCMAHPSVMYRRSLLEERNPIYNEDYIYSQDYELWTFLMLRGHKFHTLPEALLLYRKSPSQISSAKGKTQLILFKKAHREFITNWLLSHQIITADESSDLEVMLNKATAALHKRKNTCNEFRKYLTYIVYVLYFSLGTYSWTYRFRYLFDRNLVAFRIPFIYSFRLLTSSRTRKNRTGFN